MKLHAGSKTWSAFNRQARQRGWIYCTAVSLFCIGFTSGVHANTANDSAATEQHRIIGGERDLSNEFPYTVALTYNINADLVQRQFCGASVIADNWVMTAAHCLYDRRGDVIELNDFKVAINARDLSNESAATEISAINAIVHPSYDHNAANPHSDIALIELATGTGITPLKLATAPASSVVGLNATVSGWGAVDNDNPSNPLYPIVLHSVSVPIVDLATCNGPDSYANSLYNNQICAGFADGGKDSCVGDSGGPLTVNLNGELQQVGLVSFGFGCALPNFYGIYTHIPFFIGWINQYVPVGDVEFEPELVAPRVTQVAAASDDSGAGSSSIMVLLLLLSVSVFRQRQSQRRWL